MRSPLETEFARLGHTTGPCLEPPEALAQRLRNLARLVREAAPSLAKRQLLWRGAEGRLEVRTIEGRLIVGRDPRADIVLAGERVSRRHAALEAGPDGAEVVDLASTNGTYVNGRRIARARLREGDCIAVGGAALYYLDRLRHES